MHIISLGLGDFAMCLSRHSFGSVPESALVDLFLEVMVESLSHQQ